MELYNDNFFNTDIKGYDLVITDPPYLHNKSHRRKDGKDVHLKSNSSFANSDLYKDGGELMAKFSDFGEKEISLFLRAINSNMKKTHAFIFCNETQLNYYLNEANNLKLKTNVLVWEKPLSIINKNRFSLNAEFIVRVYTKGCTLNKVDDNALYGRVQRCGVVRGKDKKHPTQKPTELIRRIINIASKEKDVIFDPFMGSGTTALACKETNRNFIGVELEEKYFKIAEQRIKENEYKLF